MTNKKNWFQKVVYFYIDGFKSMKLGRTLWLIILLKLFFMFFVLRMFFFPNYLKSNFKTDKERSEYILESLTK
ncbi:DUF4492 domain-containing protein [Prolixibacteraceae bacterium JC049]|nr:DUF4492 domain-containing protein [Prolixibacteraceae bacterium JC049]